MLLALMASLVIPQSVETRTIHDAETEIRRTLGKLAPNSTWELLLDALGIADTKQTRRGLARLTRYNLDGALAEQYDCWVLAHGKSILAELESLDADTLRKECETEAGDEKLDIDRVCAPSVGIRSRAKELIDAVKHDRRCEEGDF